MEYLPAGHNVQEGDAIFVEYVPLRQRIQLDSLEAPVVFEYDPALQATQTLGLAPSTTDEYLPLSQGTQDEGKDRPTTLIEYDPV